MTIKAPVHPIAKSALIPVLYTHPNGVTQTYWVSLKRFMEERNKGTPIQRIPREKHRSVIMPSEDAKDFESEFIENFIDFGVAGLEIKENKYEAELIAKVEIKKNGRLVKIYPIKVDRKKIARAIIGKIMGVKY